MQRRSQQGEILDCIPELGRIERANSRAARERNAKEREDHVHRLGMENQGVDPPGVEDPQNEGLNGNGVQQQVPGYGQAAGTPIGAFDMPNLRDMRTGIPTPAIAANSFEVKSSLINMAQNHRYNGLPLEDPLDHLDLFERLCRTVKMNGVPEEAVKMILFPFSLGNKAAQWEKNVPSRLVSTWDNCKKEFVNKFYSKQKTAKIRNDITTFKQMGNESLYEAWERLKEYIRSCPHHGVPKENLLGIFHRGILEKHRRALDTASYGCFANLTAVQGEQLIENLAQSDACYDGDYDRNLRDSDWDHQRYKELNEKIDKLGKVFLINKKEVNYVGEGDGAQQGYYDSGYNGSEEVQEEVNYLGNQNNYQGSYQNRFNNPNNMNNNLSYRSNNVENPQDQYYPPQQPQAKPFQPRPYGNPPLAQNLQWRGQGNQGGFQFQGQQRGNNNSAGQAGPSNHVVDDNDVKAMLRQLIEGQKKGQFDTNERMNKLERKMDGGYNDLQAKVSDIYSHMKTLDNQIAQVASSSQRPPGKLPGKPEQNPKDYCNVILSSNDDKEGFDLISRLHEAECAAWVVESTKVVEPVAPTRICFKVVPPVMTRETKQIGYEKTTSLVVVEDKSVEVAEPREYEPPLPYPRRFLTKADKDALSRFKAKMCKIGVPLPPMENLSGIPAQIRFIKALLAHPEEVEKLLRNNGELDHVPPYPKVLPKEEDQGTFFIPCTFGEATFDDALCDSGASVSVLSHNIVKMLGITNMEKHSTSISFGDASIKYPVGKLVDYPLKVGKCVVPTDFTVVEMGSDCVFPLILGRPFLNTVGANLDFFNKRVVLERISRSVSYPIKGFSGSSCGVVWRAEDGFKPPRLDVVGHELNAKVGSDLPRIKDPDANVLCYSKNESRDAFVEKIPLTDPKTA